MAKCPRKPMTNSWEDKDGHTITEIYDFGPCDPDCALHIEGECAERDRAAALWEIAGNGVVVSINDADLAELIKALREDKKDG